MSEHTKGQITIIEHSWSDTGLYVDGNQIALISIESEATEENQDQLEKVASANARRLAAAWNAFDGVSPPLVEFIADHGGVKLILGESSKMESELNAARALLREVLDHDESAMRQKGLGLAQPKHIDRIRSYLDACDTLEGKC